MGAEGCIVHMYVDLTNGTYRTTLEHILQWNFSIMDTYLGIPDMKCPD